MIKKYKYLNDIINTYCFSKSILKNYNINNTKHHNVLLINTYILVLE